MEPETRMQKAIQLFEQDFARWSLHVPEADAAARQSGVVHEAGWHVLYDFGQDSNGEYLDYYAALRDATDPAVTDDWHVRLYETGDRVQLPTVLEAYMYSRDPTPEELARARRKFANQQAPGAPPKPASPRAAIPQPASPPPASAQPASPEPASPPIAPKIAAATPVGPRPVAAPAAGPSPRPVPRPATVGGTPAGIPSPMPGAPRQPAIAASAVPSVGATQPGSAGAARSAPPGGLAAPAPSSATALGEPSPASNDIALEVGLDLALAGVEPVPGGDTLASWLMTPAFGSTLIEPAKPAPTAPTPVPPPEPKPAALADDDAQASDLVFVSEPPPARTSDGATARTSGRISNPTAAMTADDDTFTISMSDDETPSVVQGISHGSAVEGLDHYHTPTRSSGGSVAETAGDALALEPYEASPPGDEVAPPIPSAERRPSPAPDAMLTTDIAAVAGSFEPWWYRPMTRRIAMLAAAVIAIILVGSAVSHFRSSAAPDGASSRSPASPSAAHAAAHAAAQPTPDADADPADASGASDSAQPGENSAADTLPVASAPSSVAADPANPAAEDGVARPAGPHSMPPIQQSGTPRAPLGSGRTTAKAGSALP
jgi:hypothetical protein